MMLSRRGCINSTNLLYYVNYLIPCKILRNNSVITSLNKFAITIKNIAFEGEKQFERYVFN